MTRRKDMAFETKVLDTKEADDGTTGTVTAIVSAFGNVDSDGDRVVKGAFADTLAAWRASGDPIPFIWSHQWRDWNAHIGYVLAEKAIETDRGLQVEAHVDLATETDRKIYRLLKERRVRQFSFAFDIEEEKETDEETDRSWSGYVNELLKLRLFECGPCLLGANEETDLLEVAARSAGRAPARVRAAIAGHDTGTSTDEWDGGAAEAALSADLTAAAYRRMYAWRDSEGDEDTQAAYRFPHHFVSDGSPGTASTRACSATIAVLNGARGGSTIPDGDRSGVYAHVARHLRAADLDVPELAEAAAAVEAAKARAEVDEAQALALELELSEVLD
jgi:HK97 family phage prohead protease